MAGREQFFTLQEVAQQLHLSEETVRRYIKSGKIPAILLGGRYRISRTDLQEFIRSSRKSPPQAQRTDHATNDGK
jgi:excisionase family DNA binding protein